MSDNEDRAALEKEAEHASARLSGSIDALEAKAEHAKDSAARDVKIIGAVAAAAFAIKELVDLLAKRREARRERIALVRKVVLPAPLLVGTTSFGLFRLMRRRRRLGEPQVGDVLVPSVTSSR